MPLKPYKFLVFPVAQDVDKKGNVTDERSVTNEGQPIPVYGGVEGLKKWADEFPALLAELEQQTP